jgi:hypothetical protein
LFCLQDEELDDLWAEMNASTKSVAVPAAKSAPKAAVSKTPSAPVVDVSKLLAEIESSEPKLEKEKVRFAGEELEVMVASDRKKSDVPTSKVDGLLESLKSKPVKKINTVEKSEIDWDMQKQDKNVQEELRLHLKSGTYLEKVSFLKRAELREYELEREGKRK